jgi:hypothetical protein
LQKKRLAECTPARAAISSLRVLAYMRNRNPSSAGLHRRRRQGESLSLRKAVLHSCCYEQKVLSGDNFMMHISKRSCFPTGKFFPFA